MVETMVQLDLNMLTHDYTLKPCFFKAPKNPNIPGGVKSGEILLGRLAKMVTFFFDVDDLMQ